MTWAILLCVVMVYYLLRATPYSTSSSELFNRVTVAAIMFVLVYLLVQIEILSLMVKWYFLLR